MDGGCPLAGVRARAGAKKRLRWASERCRVRAPPSSPRNAGARRAPAFTRATLAWANLPLRAKGLVVVAIPLAALLVSALLYFISENEDQQAEHWVAHTHEVRTDIQQALNILLDATNGIRGYLLTGQETFLNPYENAIQTLPDDLAHLARLVQNDPVQAARMHQTPPLGQQ